MVCAHLSTLLLSLQSKKYPVTVGYVRLSAVLCSFHSEYIKRELKLNVVTGIPQNIPWLLLLYFLSSKQTIWLSPFSKCLHASHLPQGQVNILWVVLQPLLVGMKCLLPVVQLLIPPFLYLKVWGLMIHYILQQTCFQFRNKHEEMRLTVLTAITIKECLLNMMLCRLLEV